MNLGNSQQSLNMLTVHPQLALVEFSGHNKPLNPGRKTFDSFIDTHLIKPNKKLLYLKNMEREQYIEKRNGGFYIAGTRVSLDSIVYSFKAGDSPETIRQNFSSLTLEQVYGAITFYLAHAPEVDANISEGEQELDRSVPPLSLSRPDVYARLDPTIARC